MFCDFGSLGEPDSGSSLTLLSGPRLRCLSAGAGLVVRLGSHGRAELNYCLPLRTPLGEAGAKGLQFGMGVEFL